MSTAHPPYCCASPMSPTKPFTVLAYAHDATGRIVEIESSVWMCGVCQKREGRPERWTATGPVGTSSTQLGPVGTSPVNRMACVLRGQRNGRR